MRSGFDPPSIILSGVCAPRPWRAKSATPQEKPFRPSRVFNAPQRAFAELKRPLP
jgi:hypothetical protein